MSAAAETNSQLEIAHVLTLDVIGYSKFPIDRQNQVTAEINSVVRSSTRYRVADAAGKLARVSTGDGTALIFFADPEAPAECAIEIAQALHSHPELPVRMGMHSGPVNKIAGLNEEPNLAEGIDMAQCVRDCGDAGHILLSKRIAYDLAPIPRWNTHLYELGECEAKPGLRIPLVNFYTDEVGNPALPSKLKRAQAEALARARKQLWRRRLTVAAAALFLVLTILGGAFFYRRSTARPPPPPAPAPDKSIVILPFVDLSQARDQEYFCDGFSEEILNALGKLEGLRVIAPTSSFSFKGKNADASEIARKLNVATMLQGSLRRDGDRIHITAQLIKTRDGIPLWLDTIEGDLKSIFVVQDEITRAVADALKIKLTGVPPLRPQQNTEAYDPYLHGVDLSNRRSEEELRQSLGYFRRALGKDPRLARAWTGIAKDWLSLADGYVRPMDAYPKAEVAARKALAIDERDADAHACLGETKRVLSFDLEGEAAELNRALEINPNSAMAHLFMALWQMIAGNRERGLSEIRTAVQLDPLSPVIANFEVAAYVGADQFDKAFDAAKRTMEIDPTYVYFEPNLALVYREQGKLKEALEIYLRLENTRQQPTPGLAITFARLARKEEARKVLAQLINVASTRYLPGEQIAAVYTALGEKDEAFRWIDRAINERSASIHTIAFSRDFRRLRSDPRFAETLRRIGLEPEKFIAPAKRR